MLRHVSISAAVFLHICFLKTLKTLNSLISETKRRLVVKPLRKTRGNWLR